MVKLPNFEDMLSFEKKFVNASLQIFSKVTKIEK